MAQEGKYISIFIPQPLLVKIEDVRFHERVGSQVGTMRMLMCRGLGIPDLIDDWIPKSRPKTHVRKAKK